uniref:Uncharacterized protein n=1 Tax=Gopherus evgoodei TaxID=1825980 RepID=A0A8C4Y9C0_9SAUR
MGVRNEQITPILCHTLHPASANGKYHSPGPVSSVGVFSLLSVFVACSVGGRGRKGPAWAAPPQGAPWGCPSPGCSVGLPPQGAPWGCFSPGCSVGLPLPRMLHGAAPPQGAPWGCSSPGCSVGLPPQGAPWGCFSPGCSEGLPPQGAPWGCPSPGCSGLPPQGAPWGSCREGPAPERPWDPGSGGGVFASPTVKVTGCPDCIGTVPIFRAFSYLGSYYPHPHSQFFTLSV